MASMHPSDRCLNSVDCTTLAEIGGDQNLLEQAANVAMYRDRHSIIWTPPWANRVSGISARCVPDPRITNR